MYMSRSDMSRTQPRHLAWCLCLIAGPTPPTELLSNPQTDWDSGLSPDSRLCSRPETRAGAHARSRTPLAAGIVQAKLYNKFIGHRTAQTDPQISDRVSHTTARS